VSAGASDAASAAETPAASRPRRMFRPARVASRLSGDEVAREGRIVRIAFDRLGSEAARQFLNTPHAALGGRPLELATASPAGAEAVERAIAALPRASAAE
jgi:uncharacterized protein (DUF2384 family)